MQLTAENWGYVTNFTSKMKNKWNIFVTHFVEADTCSTSIKNTFVSFLGKTYCIATTDTTENGWDNGEMMWTHVKLFLIAFPICACALYDL